jgi:hypothetical protein
MDAASILLVLLAAGVNFGWQPADNNSNGYEYIVQVEPELLDVLRRGETVPIESNVPPEVGPIRKVSIIVGRGDVPRETISAVERTAYFADEGRWTSGQTNAAPPVGSSTYDRYALPAAGGASGVSPPPSVLERTQAAITETGTTLSDGIQAGVQAANQQLSQTGEQVIDSTRRAGQEFGQELQDFVQNPGRQLQSSANDIRATAEQSMGAIGNQLQQVTNPFVNSNSPPATGTSAQAGVAPPPWSSTSPGGGSPIYTASGGANRAPQRTATGWTSIGSDMAPPPLTVPELVSSPTASRDDNWPPRTASNGGPGFPPLDESYTSQDTQTAVTSIDALEGDTWSQPPQSLPTNTPQLTNNQGVAVQSPGAEWQVGGAAASPNANLGASQMSTAGSLVDGTQPRGINQPGVNQNQMAAAPTPEQPPWVPFLVVSLALVGSLSANLFLGWSYLEARQRYRSLVRKTADTFRRTAAPAAA